MTVTPEAQGPWSIPVDSANFCTSPRCTWPSLAEDCQRESSPRSQFPRPARSCVLGLCSLPNPIEAFRQLDVRAPRILDERDRDIERRDLGVRAFELDTVRLELLGER